MSSRGPKRQTAAERREAILRVAIDEFAMYGYYGGSTERIAAEVGISQPYVQRLFGTKKALFIAALQRVCDDILEGWRQALADLRKGHPGAPTAEARIEALRPAYYQFVQEVSGLRLVLQASAAAADDDIRNHLKTRMSEMFQWLREATGASYETVQTFWAHGMMLTVAASIGAMHDVRESEWARAMLMMPNEVPIESVEPAPRGMDEAGVSGQGNG